MPAQQLRNSYLSIFEDNGDLKGVVIFCPIQHTNSGKITHFIIIINKSADKRRIGVVWCTSKTEKAKKWPLKYCKISKVENKFLSKETIVNVAESFLLPIDNLIGRKVVAGNLHILDFINVMESVYLLIGKGMHEVKQATALVEKKLKS